MNKIRLLLTHLLLVAMISTTISPVYVYADEFADEAGASEDRIVLEEESSFDTDEAATSGYEEDSFEEDFDTTSGNPPVEIKKLPASQRVISAEKKGSLEEALAMLPETWSVIFDGDKEEEVAVTWTCKDDFNAERQSSYVFVGTIDDETVKDAVSDDMASRLTMEILFDDQQWDVSDEHDNEGELPMIETVLSDYSIIPDIDKEEGTDVYDEDFVSDYGSNADSVIETGREFVGANSKLSSSVASVFKKISPTSQNYYYQHLSKAQKKFYNKIDSNVTQYLYYGKNPTSYAGRKYTSFMSYSGLSAQGAWDVVRIYYANNPQAFFLTTSASSNGSGMAISFLPDAASKSKLQSRAKTIANTLKSMSKQIKKQKGDYNKIKKAQYLLCKRVKYDHYANDYTNGNSPWTTWKEGHIMYCQSLMSAMSGSRKMTVCAGYGKSISALLRLAGIEATDVNGAGHEWSKVYLYGKWYILDATWDDTDNASICNYNYLLKSDDTRHQTYLWQTYWNGVAPKSPSNYNPKAKTYKITYHLNKGTNNRLNPAKYTANAGKIKLYSPTRKGYKFKGWYTNKKFKGKKITSITAIKRKNVSLYAKWKKK